MNILEIKDLGLAAHAKTKGLRLLKCEDRVFVFESIDWSLAILSVDYANSCCHQHDSNVMYLRRMMMDNC